ncbi:MAG TPA: tetratricopeptide repeat protein [Bryobacteraceae bacterium]|nr:tetratricopeptide repeat protein [Bryobacteraceae bacterium]
MLAFAAAISLAAQTQPAPAQPDKPETKKRALVQPEAENKAVATRPAGKTYALIIGISRYGMDPPVTSLQFADKDAETFAALLKTPIGGELQNQDQIRLLTNEKATRAGVDDAVHEMASLHGTNANTLIVFVAAHGVYLKTEEDPETHRVIQRDPYILTFESNPQDAKTTGYPMADFRRMIAEQAEHFGRVLVFLDVCHAGNVAGIGGGTDLEASVRRVFEGRAGELGVMLASHAKKFALESSNFGGGHGAFSYFLISGLNGEAAQSGTNEITFANLAVYVVKNVSEYTGSQQTPDYVATDDDMVLVADTRKARLGLPPAQPLSDSEVRSLRARHTRGLNSPAASVEATSGDAFDIALQQGRLLPEEPGSAAQLLASLKNDPNQPPAEIERKQHRLQVALEDRGQEVMTRYLEGEEIPQTKGDFERCAKLFQEALQLKPDAEFDRSRALFCEGRARIFDGQFAEAQKLLESSIQIDSKRAYAYNALGIAQLEQIARTGQGFDAATDALRNAMRYAPYWAYPVHNLALVSSERGDYDRAIQLYQYGMSIAPRYSYLPYNLGLLYERIGDFDNANIWFQKAREVLETYGRKPAAGPWPERARIWNALGTVARSQDRNGRALQFFEKALADDSQDLNARHNLALAFAARRNFSKADALWIANIQDAPDFLPTRIAYAGSLAERGEKAAAIDLYEKIIAEKADYVGAREALARLYLGQGQAAKALDEVDRALVRSSSNAALLELRGDAHARLGQESAAREDWTRAMNVAADRGFRARVNKKLRSLAVAVR